MDQDLSKTIKKINTFSDSLKEALDRLDAFNKSLKKMSEVSKVAAKKLKKTTKETRKLTDQTNMLAASMKQTSSASSKLKKTMKTIPSISNKAWNMMNKTKIIKSFTKTATHGFQSFINKTNQAKGKLSAFFNKMKYAGLIKKSFGKLGSVFTSTFGGLKSGAGKAFGAMKSTSSKAFAGMKSGLLMVADLAVKAATAVFSLASTALKSAAKRETQVIPIQAAIHAKLGGGEDAKAKAAQLTSDLVNEMKKKADGSRLSTDNFLASANSFTPITTDQSELNQLVDFANRMDAATGKGMSSLSDELMQVMQGNTDAFAQKYDIADQFVGFDQLQTNAEKIQRLDEILEGIGHSTYAVELMDNSAMGEYLQFTTRFKEGLAQVGLMALDKLKPLLSLMNEIFSADKMQPFIQMGGNLFAGLIEGVMYLIQFIQLNWPKIQQYFANGVALLTPVFNAFKDAMITIIEAVKPYWGSFIETILSVQTAVKPVFTLIASLIRAIGSVVEAVMPTVMDIFNTVFPMAADLAGTLAEGINWLVTEIVEPLIPLIGDVISIMWGIVEPIIGSLKSAFDFLADSIGSVVGNVTDFFKSVGDVGGELIGNAINFVTGGDSVDGSHSSGLSYVPRDGYIARLHKGERVLTSEENKAYGSNSMHIAKLADQIVVREDADIDRIASVLVSRMSEAGMSYA
ncbi:hypothetical protein [Longirhabdus pacifica]|uniref:hypothetical protein n=1 Tax=Longirhabdus pacifica TaxID=2305227 RepID=UPI001008E752|nr:hypothetical protein [Longirhabdus pacifica]